MKKRPEQERRDEGDRRRLIEQTTRDDTDVHPFMDSNFRVAHVRWVGWSDRHEPIELGLSGREALVMQGISGDPIYVSLFREAFPGEPGD